MVGLISGKTVLVTGGSRGIGFGLVQRLVERKNRVVATTRDTQNLSPQLRQLQADHPDLVKVTQLDTSDTQGIAKWAAELKQSGQGHIDLLFNNAGLYGRRLSFAEFEASDFLSNFTTNAMGPFFVTQQLLKQGLIGGLIGQPGTLVVNVTSIMGSIGDPTVSAVSKGGYAYRAGKAALNSLTVAMSADLAEQGIQTLLVHPGYVKTDLTGGAGWIDVETSTSGILGVIESDKPLNGRFYAYDGTEVPW